MKLTYFSGDGVDLTSIEASLYGTNDVVRQMTRASIRRYVQQWAELLGPSVLDYGAGKVGTCAIPQPYRSLLKAESYLGWEPGDSPLAPFGQFTGVLCTQVLQNVDNPAQTLRDFFGWLKHGGHVVITYPMTWQEIEHEKWRFTRKGMWKLAHDAGFSVVNESELCSVDLDGSLHLGLIGGYVGIKS